MRQARRRPYSRARSDEVLARTNQPENDPLERSTSSSERPIHTSMLGDRIRRASLVAVIAAMTIVGAVLLAPTAKADGGATNRFVADTNAARAAAGLPVYAYADDLAAVAQGQAERMAARSDVYHNPNLGSEVSGWKKAGENVGA